MMMYKQYPTRGERMEDNKYKRLKADYEKEMVTYEEKLDKFYEFASQDVDLLNRVEAVCKLYYEICQ